MIVLMACGGGNDPEPAPEEDPLDRKPMLTFWADNIIIPSYVNFKDKLSAMTTKSNTFLATPNVTTLADFRAAWVQAYIEWQKVELFETGPGDRNTIRNFFNIYPADVTRIAANMADPSANMEVPAAYASQGFPALDYLINGLADTDEAIVAYYTTAPDAAARIAYVKKISDRMNSIFTNVLTGWQGEYRETFISKTGLDIGSPIAQLVNAYVLNYERFIRSGKVGIPSGAMASSGGTKHPEKVEAYYKKDLSKILAATAHQATIDFFNGKSVSTSTNGPSLKSYLDALNAKDNASGKLLSEIISTQLATADAKLDLLSDNFSQQVQSNNQPLIDAYTEMQKAVRMLKVDMTSAMSITITYTDNDGD